VVVCGIWVEEPALLDAVLARPETQTLLRAIRKAHARGAIVAAACAGVSLVAAAGLLDGARATTTWWLASHFRRSFPRVELDASACLVSHGRIVTAGAVFGIADLALHLVARFLGPAKAHRCSSLLLLDRHHRRPRTWRPS
jgi:transcriptional regulator GlxA family with amidase domain